MLAVGDTSVFLPLEDYFGRRGIRTAIVLCQLPLTVTVTFIIALAVLFNPVSLLDQAFLLILLLHVLILVLCLVLPWNRLPAGSFVVIPVVDCLVVGLTREVGGPVLSVVGLLMAFPVIWLSVSASKARMVLAITASLCPAIASPLASGNEVEQSDLIRRIVFQAILAGLAITAHAVARILIRNRDMEARKDRELVRLHEATKDHEQLLDTVLETVNVGVWAMNTNGADILTNRRLRGDRSWVQESMTGRNPFTVRLGQVDGRGDGPADLAVRGGSFTNMLVQVGAGHQQRTFSAAARPLHDAEGRPKGSVLAFTDVTALVKAQTARDKFVATISHELRTPLTSILGYLELLRDEPDPQYMGIIERNAERLLSLVNDLLLVASEDLELRRRPTNVSDLLHASARNAGPASVARGITVHVQTPGDITADVDACQFAKAIDQLLSNAIKFSPEGSQVTITLRGKDGEFEFCVSDQGIGMTEQEQDNAFTKFFRADHAMETAIPGAGLGLPISKAIIEAHGGTIGLNSHPGSGTTVTVSVPN